MALSSNKRGDAYVMLQGNLGQYQSPDATVAHFDLAASNTYCTSVGSGICGETRTLAYWRPGTADGFLVAWPWNEDLASLQWLQPTSESQYTFESVSSSSNPFSGLDSGTVTGYAGGALGADYQPV